MITEPADPDELPSHTSVIIDGVCHAYLNATSASQPDIEVVYYTHCGETIGSDIAEHKPREEYSGEQLCEDCWADAVISKHFE